MFSCFDFKNITGNKHSVIWEGAINLSLFSSDSSSSGSSLFKTQCVPVPPKQRQRNTIRKFVHIPKSTQATESSSDSSIEPRPLTLKAIFERFKNKKRKRKKRKYKPTGRSVGRPKGRRTTRYSQITEKQFKDKRPGFPFLESENGRKPLPWRKILTFEVSHYLYMLIHSLNVWNELLVTFRI